MSPRVFIAWLVVTVVTVVLAVVVGLGRETATFDLVKREPVFETLRENPDAAAKIEVRSRFGEFTLERQENRWVTPDRDGYPVDETDVRRLIVGLSDMRYVERKTSNPERFTRLEVEDIDAGFSESAHVTVSGADGGALTDIIVGRPSARFFEGRASGTYIRVPDTTEVWLVSGVTNIQTRLVPWLDRQIVEIPANEVARIVIGEGEAGYVLERASADDAFAIEGAPEGREPDAEKIRPVSRAFAGVDLEDVKPRGEIQLPADAAVAEIETFGGLNVRVRMAEIDRKRWAEFEARFTGNASDDSDAAKSARDAVTAINSRVGDWTYWVPSAFFSSLTRPVEEVLTEPENAS